MSIIFKWQDGQVKIYFILSTLLCSRDKMLKIQDDRHFRDSFQKRELRTAVHTAKLSSCFCPKPHDLNCSGIAHYLSIYLLLKGFSKLLFSQDY